MALRLAGSSLMRRALAAAALDPSLYEEVESDPSATGQAFVVVLCSGLAAGIGTLGFGPRTLAAVLFDSTMALLTWGIWAVIIYEIGARLIPEPQTRSDVGELLRTLGFATAPAGALVLAAMPALAVPVFAVTAVWMLWAMVVAVRQALDFESTARALGVCLLGWTLVIGLVLGIGLLLGPSLS